MTPMRPALRRDGAAGITLIEMLVSLVIFGFVGIASFTMLDTLLTVRDRTDGRLEAVMQVDRALTLFDRDFAQGNPQALQLGEAGLSLGSVQGRQHSYSLQDGTLQRTITSGTEVLTQSLLTGIESGTFEVLDPSDTWQSTWPLEGVAPFPRAVRMLLTLSQGRELSRIVVLTDSVRP